MSTFNYTVNLFENGTWNLLHGWVRPFGDVKTLDESLDSGQIKLSCVRRKEPIRRFTPIRIDIEQISRGTTTNESMYYIAQNTSILQRSFAYPDNQELYDHEITFTELTKSLERVICDSMTSTNYLAHLYASGSQVILPVYSGDHSQVICMETYISPVYIGSPIKIFSHSEMFSLNNPGFPATPGWNVRGNYTEVWIDDELIKTLEKNETYTVNADKIAKVKIIYYGSSYVSYPAPPSSLIFDFAAIFNLEIQNQIKPKPFISISEVIKKLLECSQTHRQGLDYQQYFLDPVVEEKYSDVPSPEFYITKSTLFEALLQVGGYIHAIPRLKWPNIVTFDELGGSTERAITQPLIGYDMELNADEYCGEIDTHVDNLLNSRDLIQGAVTEPYAGGFKTVRCEESKVEINDDNALILTEFPIYRLVKLEMGYIDENTVVGDITQFVYEAAEYGALSDYTSKYPYSKGYALRYAQGDNKITGLSYKIENVIQALSTPVIENIVKEKGYSLNTPYKNLAFRVTYIPMVNARLTQRKPYAEDYIKGNSIIFNQSANTVEAELYGENLKGNIAKIGNPVEHRSYYFIHLQDIPKPGELIDGKYVSQVKCEYERKFIRTTITLTPNFNRLAEYYALNSNYRLFDVSEKQSVERYINYGENIVIGDKINVSVSAPLLMNDGQRAIVRSLIQTTDGFGSSRVTSAALQALAQDKTPIQDYMIGLPVISTAVGNSLAFNCRYHDNFSAGYRSTYLEQGDVNQKFLKSVQQLVPYADVYGEFYYLGMQMMPFGNTTGWLDQRATADFDGYSNMLPIVEENWDITTMNTGAHPFVVRKDSREVLNVTIQLHFMANRRSIVIGPALSQNNLLVTEENAQKAGQLYLLPYRLNMLNSKVDLNGAHLLLENIANLVEVSGKRIKSFTNTTQGTYKSWAIIDPTSKKLYIGENTELKPGAASREIYFNFVDHREG